MKTYDYCGEYRKITKISHALSISNHTNLFLGSIGYGFDYICKDCNEALTIKRKKGELKYEKEKEERRKNWIKERNKILKKVK